MTPVSPTFQIVSILDKNIEEDGWWKGELNGNIGIFPTNHVQYFEEKEVLLIVQTVLLKMQLFLFKDFVFNQFLLFRSPASHQKKKVCLSF